MKILVVISLALDLDLKVGEVTMIERTKKEWSKAIMRRLRLLTYSWSLKDNLNKPTGLAEKVKSFCI